MSSLANVERFRVPTDIVVGTDQALRAAGAKELESFVLWTGVVDGPHFTILCGHVPKQTAFSLESGLCVRVEGEELHRINRWLFENGQLLAVQVHSHPGDAYHSDTDNAYPIMTLKGGLSIVVPYFGKLGTVGKGTATYRLGERGWDELSASKAKRVLEVIP